MEGRGSPDDRGIDYRHVYLDPFLIISEYSLIKIDMIILRNNERLMAEIDRIAEVAGYLWTKGWAERNGGNISVNLTTLLSEEEKALPALVSSIPLQEAMTALCGHVFYVTGTGKRMRYVAKDPFANGSLIRIAADGKSYDILAEQPIQPTSELPSHLLMHNFLRAKGRDNRVVLHTHPTDIIGMTHCKPFLDSVGLSCRKGSVSFLTRYRALWRWRTLRSVSWRSTTWCSGRSTVSLPSVRT